MTEPKNALVKQYKKLFRYDGVELEITPDAIDAIAKKAIERKTGARGLRSIFERTMNDIMFEIPSRKDVRKCVVRIKYTLPVCLPSRTPARRTPSGSFA